MRGCQREREGEKERERDDKFVACNRSSSSCSTSSSNSSSFHYLENIFVFRFFSSSFVSFDLWRERFSSSPPQKNYAQQTQTLLMGSSGEKSAKKAKKEKKEEKSASKKRDRDGLPIPSTPGDNDDDEKLNPVCAIASPLADGKLTKKLLKVVKKGKK